MGLVQPWSYYWICFLLILLLLTAPRLLCSLHVPQFRRVFTDCNVTVPPGHMDLLVARFDKDSNGKVDFNEFAKWMAPNYHSNHRYGT